jgi:hypothetical protein
MSFAHWILLASLFAIGCGGEELGCDFGVATHSVTIALDPDGGTADLAGASCLSACESHEAAANQGGAVTSCAFVALDGGAGVSCAFTEGIAGCP